MTGRDNNRINQLRSLCESRAEFSQKLRVLSQKDLTLHELKAVVRILREFDEPVQPLKIAVLGSYTIELLKDYWVFHGLLHGFETKLYFAPYGQIMQELRPDSLLSQHKPEFTYLLMQWTDLLPALADPLHGVNKTDRESFERHLMSNLENLLKGAQTAMNGPVVLSFLPRFTYSGLGLYDAMADSSESMFFSDLKESVSTMLRKKFPSFYFDDGDQLLSVLGGKGTLDHRLWHVSRFPFTAKGANLFVQRLFRFPILMRTPKAKCIVLDCDNTLWGGIIGEDGMDGIKLGPDYPGSCYGAFQRRLLDFLYRGYLLAICSKNNVGDVEQVLREHPHMILREENFAAIRANWEPKPDNLRSLAHELSLGLDSFIFVDDSPYECKMVQKFLPEIRVVQVPEKPLEIPSCLDHMQELELLSFTDEDRDRFKMYVQNRQRRELSVKCGDLDDYLDSLQMKMNISLNDKGHIGRLAQMTQKTNQFNLTTKRYTEKDIQDFVKDESWLVADFSLSDLFGDNGIVGLMLLSGMTSNRPDIDTFLMSCRVIGRKAEEAFLHQILQYLQNSGKTSVTARYLPTIKNGLVKDFWSEQEFVERKDGTFFCNLECITTKHPSLHHFKILFDGGRR